MLSAVYRQNDRYGHHTVAASSAFFRKKIAVYFYRVT